MEITLNAEGMIDWLMYRWIIGV